MGILPNEDIDFVEITKKITFFSHCNHNSVVQQLKILLFKNLVKIIMLQLQQN